jgi:hypothetical protein
LHESTIWRNVGICTARHDYSVRELIRIALLQIKLRHYPWSSYPATVGAVALPFWLSMDWLLSQFAKTQSVAQRRYAEFVAQGRKLPRPGLN